jgi:hypothetical protein
MSGAARAGMDVVGFGARRFHPASAGLLTVPHFAGQERLPDGPMLHRFLRHVRSSEVKARRSARAHIDGCHPVAHGDGF